MWRLAGSGEDPKRLTQAHRLISRVVIILAFLTAPAILVYAALPRSIITLFSSSAYTSSAGELWVLAFATVLFVIGQQLTLHGLVEKRPAIYIPAKFLHAALLIVLLFALIPPFGLAGAIYALLAANTVQLGAVLLTTLTPAGAWPSVTRRAPFSTLITTYAGERPDRLRMALESLIHQTLPAVETVLVVDGRVGDAQESVIARFESQPGFVVVRCPYRRG